MADEIVLSGLRELREFLGGLDDRVDDWLYETVDAGTFIAEDSLKAHAPGSIKDLVGVDLPRFGLEGSIVTGEAYVDPDVEEGLSDRGLGSSPGDYPFYVDVGTGIFGEFGKPITALPGHVMGPIEYGGRMIYLKEVKGQPAQHYSDAAARDVDAFLDFRILSHSSKIVTRGR